VKTFRAGGVERMARSIQCREIEPDAALVDGKFNRAGAKSKGRRPADAGRARTFVMFPSHRYP
jgi:hypothetical protein